MSFIFIGVHLNLISRENQLECEKETKTTTFTMLLAFKIYFFRRMVCATHFLILLLDIPAAACALLVLVTCWRAPLLLSDWSIIWPQTKSISVTPLLLH